MVKKFNLSGDLLKHLNNRVKEYKTLDGYMNSLIENDMLAEGNVLLALSILSSKNLITSRQEKAILNKLKGE